jgi:hypothetical protein
VLLQEELKRYNRQIMMDKWDEDVQEGIQRAGMSCLQELVTLNNLE